MTKYIYRVVRRPLAWDRSREFPETNWHTSIEYCQNYIDNMSDLEKLDKNVTIAKEELIED